MTELARAYKAREPLVLEDDAEIGIDPRRDSILDMGRRSDLSARDWYGVLISLGVAAVGAWLLVMAVLDPEPYSKVAVAIATGAVLLGSGGFYAVRILTNVKPPRVSVSRTGTFEIDWS
jgi:hypothetical protein